MADLGTVVQDMLRRAGVPGEQVDTSALSGWLPGMVLASRTPLRSVIEQLQAFWQFDMLESGGRLVFRPRGQEAVASLDESECVSPADKPEEAVTITRLPPLQLPQQLDIVYSDSAADYQPGTQSALRQLATGASPSTLSTPMALTADMARAQAQLLLDAAWAERYQVRFAVPPHYLFLEAGDVVQLTVRGRVWTLRLVRVLLHNGWLECECVTTDARAYTQQATGAAPSAPVGVRATGAGELFVLDIPLVDDSDDSAGYYLAAGRQRGDAYWRFATIYEQTAGQTDYALLTVLASAAVNGSAQTILSGNAPTAYWDDANTVTVTLADGELANASDSALLQGANALLLGDEILQFGQAELTDLHTWTLSHLLRGRRGTEWAMDGHAVGERCVLLGGDIVRQGAGITLNILRTLKSVPNGQTLDAVAAVPFTPQGICLRPFSPVHLQAKRDSGGDITLTWIRRTRRSGQWLSGSDVPLAEEQERYMVEILNGLTVVRSMEVFAPVLVYAASQQIADFGSVQSALTVRVAQVSAIVGRGYAAAATV